MFRRFTAERFRGFEKLDLTDLGRLNLFIGGNNTGKTAVLEAMFLHLAPTRPQFAAAFVHRGQGGGATVGLPAGLRYAAEWKAMFHGGDTSRPISLRSAVGPSDFNDLRISIRGAADALTDDSEPFNDPSGLADSAEEYLSTRLDGVELLYEFDDGRGHSWTSTAAVRPDPPRERLRVGHDDGATRPPLPFARFISTSRQSRTSLARQLSQALSRGSESSLVEVLGLLDNRLRSLLIRVEGSYPAVYVELAEEGTIPLRMMGEGITRALEIILGIADVAGGVLMIDEIDIGLHYSALPDVWRVIGRAAERSEVQVMATTHSYECVRAAHGAATEAGQGYDLRVHRLERDRAGKVFATSYDRESLDTSLDLAWEIR